MQIAFWNEEETEADAIQMSFAYFGNFSPSLTYQSGVLTAEEMDAGTRLDMEDTYLLGIDTTSENPDKFALLNDANLPNSSTMWKPETSKSSRIDDDGTFRVYLQRTTPSVAGIGIGEAIAATSTFFTGDFAGASDLELNWAERPAEEEEEEDNEGEEEENAEEGENEGEEGEEE